MLCFGVARPAQGLPGFCRSPGVDVGGVADNENLFDVFFFSEILSLNRLYEVLSKKILFLVITRLPTMDRTGRSTYLYLY